VKTKTHRKILKKLEISKELKLRKENNVNSRITERLGNDIKTYRYQNQNRIKLQTNLMKQLAMLFFACMRMRVHIWPQGHTCA